MLFSHAYAAGWGDLTVQSALGQPLRAEIELISAAKEEDGALSVKLAPYDTYRQANIEFNPVLLSLRFAIEQRGARQVVRITSAQPVNEPFVDMLLELHSNSGRVVREYVFLLDPATRHTAETPVALPGNAVALASAPVAPPAPAPQARPAATPAPAAARPAPAVAGKAAATGAQAPVRTAASEPQSKPGVKEGANSPNANPAATTQAGARPRLTLSSVRAASSPAGDRAAGAPVDEYAAMEKAVADANARVHALEEKVGDLQKLLEVTNTLLAEMQKRNELLKASAEHDAVVATPGQASPPTPPASPVSAPQASPAEPKSSEAAAAPIAPVAPIAASASTVPVAPAAPAKAATPPVLDSTSAVDMLMLPGAALLLVMLGAAGVYAARRRKTRQPFKAHMFAGPEPENAAEGKQGAESAVEALQAAYLLPAGQTGSDEADALSEADVYIAYGRDVQAEDILKEALRQQPERHAVRVKLLTIYATRKDLPSFEALARELRGLTRGEGDEWKQAATLGMEIDPGNPLYADAKQAAVAERSPVAERAPTLELVLERVAATTAQPAGAVAPVLDIERLDSPLPELTPTEEITQVALPDASDEADLDVDDMLARIDAEANAISAAANEAAKQEPDPIDFDFLTPVTMENAPREAIPELPSLALDSAQAQTGPIDFDFLQSNEQAALVPELPAAALEEPQAPANLIDFDFLEPVARADEKPEAPRK